MQKNCSLQQDLVNFCGVYASEMKQDYVPGQETVGPKNNALAETEYDSLDGIITFRIKIQVCHEKHKEEFEELEDIKRYFQSWNPKPSFNQHPSADPTEGTGIEGPELPD